MPPEQRSHPAKDIEPLAVFAARRDARALATGCPESTEARMFGKSGFIFQTPERRGGPDGAVFFYLPAKLLGIFPLAFQVGLACAGMAMTEAMQPILAWRNLTRDSERRAKN